MRDMTPEEAMRNRAAELAVNPSPRLPVALCLDVSASMGGEPLRELNQGVQEFYRACKEHPQSSQSVEVAVIAFGSNARLAADFCDIVGAAVPSLTITEGSTNMTAGVQLALDRLNQAKAQYKVMGVEYFQPWFVLMTDGAPDNQSYLPLAAKIVELEASKNLTVFPIGIGSGADMSVLAKFSGKRPPLKLKGLNFPAFFEWLSQSVNKLSESSPGDAIKLDTSGIGMWGEL